MEREHWVFAGQLVCVVAATVAAVLGLLAVVPSGAERACARDWADTGHQSRWVGNHLSGACQVRSADGWLPQTKWQPPLTVRVEDLDGTELVVEWQGTEKLGAAIARKLEEREQ